MAKANTNGVNAPAPPISPFVVEGDAESTGLYINQVLAYFKERKIQDAVTGETNIQPIDDSHHYGEMLILSGLQESVTYLWEIADANARDKSVVQEVAV